MIHIKNTSEIQKMREGGKILGEVLSILVKEIKPGMSEFSLDQLAEKLIVERGGEPGFKKVPGACGVVRALCDCGGAGAGGLVSGHGIAGQAG